MIMEFLQGQGGQLLVDIFLVVLTGGTLSVPVIAKNLLKSKALNQGVVKLLDNYSNPDFKEKELDTEIKRIIPDAKINSLKELRIASGVD